MKQVLLVSAMLGVAFYAGYASHSNAYNFTNLHTKPASREAVLDNAAQKIDTLCYEKAGMTDNNFIYKSCTRRARDFTKMFKARIAKDMPHSISSQDDFKRYSLRMINCIVPIS